MAEVISKKTPWHLWVVGAVGILWNGFGCFNYFMSKTQGADYMSSAGLSEDQIAHLLDAPAWMSATWAIGVWGALLATILLLLRNRHAVGAFVISTIAFLVNAIYGNFIDPMPGLTSDMLILPAVIFVGCLFFIWYSRWARGARHLK